MDIPISPTTLSWTTNLDGIAALALRTTATPNPETLAPNHILVRILSVSLNYKDAEIINGLFRHHKSSVAPPNLVPCADSVGVVVAVGPSSDTTPTPTPTWQLGTHVLSVSYPNYLTGPAKPEYLAAGVGSGTNGVLTTYRVFPSNGVVACPPSLIDSPDLACCLPIAGTTAWMGLNWWRPISSPRTADAVDTHSNHPASAAKLPPSPAPPPPSQSQVESRSTSTSNPPHQPSRDNEGAEVVVLLQGTGGVSTFGLLFARHLHMRSIMTSSSDAKLRRAKEEFGADETINYRTHHGDWDEQVLKMTGGQGADIIFENGGGGPPATNSTLKSLRCVKFGGVVNAIGYVGGKTDLLASPSSSSYSSSSPSCSSSLKPTSSSSAGGDRGTYPGPSAGDFEAADREIQQRRREREREQEQEQAMTARLNINVHALSRNIIIKGLLNGPRDRMEEMLHFVERHKIKPVVDRVFAFEEARDALQYLWDGKHFGKVVIRVADR